MQVALFFRHRYDEIVNIYRQRIYIVKNDPGARSRPNESKSQRSSRTKDRTGGNIRWIMNAQIHS